MKQWIIPWVKYMYSISKDAWESTHTIHRWTPTITYRTPSLKETYITLNKLLEILLQRWRLTMSSSLSLQIMTANFKNIWCLWTCQLLKFSRHVIKACRLVTHNTCCQLQYCVLAFHSEHSSLTCLLIWQYHTADVSTLHCWGSSTIQWIGLPSTPTVTVLTLFLQLAKFWHHMDRQ